MKLSQFMRDFGMNYNNDIWITIQLKYEIYHNLYFIVANSYLIMHYFGINYNNDFGMNYNNEFGGKIGRRVFRFRRLRVEMVVGFCSPCQDEAIEPGIPVIGGRMTEFRVKKSEGERERNACTGRVGGMLVRKLFFFYFLNYNNNLWIIDFLVNYNNSNSFFVIEW